MTVDETNGEGSGPEADPPIQPLPGQLGTGPISQATMAAAAAFLGEVYPSAAVAIAAAGAFLPALGQRLNEIQGAKTEELLTGAVAESALTPESVVRQLAERDDLALLAAEAIDAARRSRLPGKAAILGRSLGAILADDALLDLESIWIRIIGVVEPPHIRILGMLLEHTGTMGTGSKLWGTGAMITVADIGDRLGLQEAVLPLIEDLTRSGLLMDPGAEGLATEDEGIYELAPDAFGRPVKATVLGAQLFARLSAAGLAESN